MSGDWTLERIAAAAGSGFGRLLQMRFALAGEGGLAAEIDVRPELLNDDGVVHGGALMAIADTVGGSAARLALPAGWRTVTSQSSTHFLRPARGPLILAAARAEHRGRRLSVWRTELCCGGRLVAVVTQTQMHLPPEG